MVEKIHMCKNNKVQGLLLKFLKAITICRSGGEILYCFQVSPELKPDLISQFVAAMSIYSGEKLGKTNKIVIQGMEAEICAVSKHGLILCMFFHPKMVKDYLEEEAGRALDLFYSQYRGPIEKKKNNQMIYERFDEQVCILIHQYLIRIGILNEMEVCSNMDQFFDVSDEV